MIDKVKAVSEIFSLQLKLLVPNIENILFSTYDTHSCINIHVCELHIYNI